MTVLNLVGQVGSYNTLIEDNFPMYACRDATLEFSGSRGFDDVDAVVRVGGSNAWGNPSESACCIGLYRVLT